ncbi:uncharacterized protein LOC129597381 [Paramacrobiotus metropolitanus]|uniref:uncharacterized protein LOC129597381 n=1 Tax=Paramacrobiotus metropolitanus TaxID=2943436 RepID=UPI002445EA5F|nr:uncharacterized protein LOC129597381 [Paramacrobiotus metropolitanus]
MLKYYQKMHRFAIFSIGFLLCTFMTTACGLSPHPQCTYNNYTRIQDCSGAQFFVPDNLNLGKINRHAHGLHLSTPQIFNRSEIRWRDIGDLKVSNLPALYMVSIRRFRLANGVRLPIREIFYDIRHKIRRLLIQDSEIGHLDVLFLQGFTALEKLWLDDNDITVIARDTFAQCCRKLQVLDLSENRLESLDWSTFQPVTLSVQEIHLRQQKADVYYTSHGRTGLQKLKLLEPVNFSLDALAILDLAKNELETVPGEILATLNATSLRIFDIRNNPFCPGDEACSCCSMKPLVEWMRGVRHSRSRHGFLVDFHCGVRKQPLSWDSGNPTGNLPGIASECGARTAAPATTPKYPSTTTIAASTHNAVEVCANMESLRTYCTAGNQLVLPFDRIDNVETTSAVFDGDGTLVCRTLINDLHAIALTMAEVTPVADGHNSSDDVHVTCHKGVVSIDNHNYPDHIQARRITFVSEPNLLCTQHFVMFLEKMEEYDAHYSPGRSAVRENISQPIPAEELCSASPPIQFVCANGRLIRPALMDFRLSNAVKMEYAGDNSFKCRQHLQSMHTWLMENYRPVLSHPNTDGVPDTVTFACQRGHFQITSLQPETSAAVKLHYYSPPNLACRNAFVHFLQFAVSLQ